MSATIQLHGGKELAEALKHLPDRVVGNVMRRAVANGANKMRDEVRRRAPIFNLDEVRYGGPHEPGLLLKSIIARTRRQRNRNQVVAAVFILKEAFYWRFIEYGTRHAVAKPFIRPAADVSGAAAAQTVIDYAANKIALELQP